VTRELREEVLRGQYRPGERLPSERDLAARFKTTRGVVRVALKKLEQLGIADVKPGGARVVAVQEASLDVVGHLLDLEDPPNPDLVDQVLEVAGALMAAAARIAVERGEAAHLDRVRELIQRLRESELDEEARFEVAHELFHTFMDASDNLVLHIIRRGLRTQIFGRLLNATWHARPDAADLERMYLELDRVIRERDPAAASEAVHSLWRGLRERVRRSLEAARATHGAAAAR
jgi:GntR family transcriptional repressor for pyruvate dehydrogenase complex